MDCAFFLGRSDDAYWFASLRGTKQSNASQVETTSFVAVTMLIGFRHCEIRSNLTLRK